MTCTLLISIAAPRQSRRSEPGQVTTGLVTLTDKIESGPDVQVRSVEVLILMPGGTKKSWDWWSDAACGGGVAGAVLSHVTDALRFMLDACVTHPVPYRAIRPVGVVCGIAEAISRS